MLKYLFTAVHKDGIIVKQTQDDVSSTMTGSAFSDVHIKEVSSFTLVGDGNEYTIDLLTGVFSHNGNVIASEESEVIDKELIYFRRNFYSLSTAAGSNNHMIEYHFGWQGKDPITGQVVTKTIAIF